MEDSERVDAIDPVFPGRRVGCLHASRGISLSKSSLYFQFLIMFKRVFQQS